MNIIDYNIKNNPIHIKPHQLLSICDSIRNKKNVYLSVKADGVYCQLKNISNKLFNKDIIFECEYIKEIDVYLVFDIHNYPSKHNNTYNNRIKYIASLHESKPDVVLNINNINNIDTFAIYIEKQNNLLKEYIKTTNDKIKWFPKFIFNTNHEINLSIINDQKINNEINSTISKESKFIDLLDHQFDLLYGSDGWIISMDNFNSIYKYKPKNHLTIDVLYKNNKFYSSNNEIINCELKNNLVESKIYRCYWNEKNMWTPKETRNDKSYPNPLYIIKQIENIHLDYWSASSLKSKLNKLTYYTFNDIKCNDLNISNILNYKKEIMKKIIININFKNKNILDIGCGKGMITNILKTNKINYNSYNGIDIDYNCITLAENKYSNFKNNFIWKDFMVHEFNEKYDVIFIINTIHYFIDNLEIFFKKVKKMLSEQNGIIIILFLNSDNIKEEFNYKNELIVKRIENNFFYFKYPWLNREFNEHIIGLEYLRNYFQNNFKIRQIEHNFNNTDDNNIVTKFWLMHNIITITLI